MIDPAVFFSALCANDVAFYTGVPDSLLKSVCGYIADVAPSGAHVITANEGGAVALASGYYLATRKLALVYMQNSGLGNCVNPLTSLTAPQVYGIPMLLLIGWRGEPRQPDEPQHLVMGQVTHDLLHQLGIICYTVDADLQDCNALIAAAKASAVANTCPVALVVKNNTFTAYQYQKRSFSTPLTREKAIQAVLQVIASQQAVIIATTGKLARELYETRLNTGQNPCDFYNVGSMGHASLIALGIALQQSEKKVYCFDGDGALLMHLGAMATITASQPHNFVHVVFNNGAHESVGGQPTALAQVDVSLLAKAMGYRNFQVLTSEAAIASNLLATTALEGPTLIEIRVNLSVRKDLGRPSTSPQENKRAFMEALNG